MVEESVVFVTMQKVHFQICECKRANLKKMKQKKKKENHQGDSAFAKWHLWQAPVEPHDFEIR